jgi:DNA-binding transcriptional ArsR family regulator
MAKQPGNDLEAHPLADIDPLIHAPARLMLLTYLSVVESADFVFLKRLTKLSWGNLSTHLTRLDNAGYVSLEKEFRGKKPHTIVSLTEDGRSAFADYRERMQEALGGDAE